MKTKLMALAALSALMLTGCSKEETVKDPLADTPITVTAGINEPGTRAGVDQGVIETKGFGLYVINASSSDYSYSNVFMSYEQDKWNSYTNNSDTKGFKTMLWHKSDEQVQVIAYHPYKADITNYAYTGSLPTDQSSADNIEASDVMYSTANVTPNNPTPSDAIFYDEDHKALNVKFNHKFSKIRVNVTKKGILTEGTVTIGVASIAGLSTEYSIDLSTGDITPSGEVSTIPMYKEQTAVSGDATYELIALPGSPISNAFTVTIDDKSYTCTLSFASNMESGQLYTFNLNAGKDRLVVSSVSVNPWTDGATISGEVE